MTTHLLLGTNMGDREAMLDSAMQHIGRCIGSIMGKSSVYETQSWGYHDADYLNQVIICETGLNPAALLEAIHSIESRMGRERSGQGYQARPIDIDILFYGSLCMESRDLTIPHPLIQERRFALIPLDGSLIHPRLKDSISSLLSRCPDQSNVRLYRKN